MYTWKCCRMCLGVKSLNPIYSAPENCDRYSNVIFMTTGIKVDINDTMSQLICTACINFINESVKFRKKCDATQKKLLSRINNKQIFDCIKSEDEFFKLENGKFATIDISNDLASDLDDDFKDYDDNVTLDTFQISNNFVIAEEKTKKENYFENNIAEKTLEVINTKRKVKDKVKRVRTKKEIKDRGKIKARVREEIECEYCHKILTSKLSLRNHYKIHTGFDVVCEHCGKKFITKRLLLMHCRAKHGYEKTDKCSYCDYKASNAEQVKIHERLHTGEKPYVCKDCGSGFHRKSSYLQHIAIHLPEKTVQCDQCPARFKSVTLMRIHKNRHRAPQYTFKCRVCDNSFARRRNVARHLQRIHGLQADQQHIDRLKVS